MNDYSSEAIIVLQRIDELAAVSEDDSCLTRTYGSRAFIDSSKQITAWMQEAGLNTRTDNIGNVRGRLSAKNKGAKTLVIGSHFDSVVNAGKFDGPLGVLIAIQLAEKLKEANIALPFNIEVIAFCDEEGVRFHSTYLGSKAVTGLLEDDLLNQSDALGLTLRDHIIAMGGDPIHLWQDVIPANEWLAYFEVHIEQGPVLCQKQIPVAFVNGIAGQKRAELVFTGVAGHAGTVPMQMRSDALCAASEWILEVERYAGQHAGALVATVGKLDIQHAASNVIPGTVYCSLDVRSTDVALLNEAYYSLATSAQNIADRRSVALVCKVVQQTDPIQCSEPLVKLLSQSIQAAGYPLLGLSSGAGHDAVAISKVSPVAMLFVKCFEGISHNPLENVEVTDIAAALKTSHLFIQSLIDNYPLNQS